MERKTYSGRYVYYTISVDKHIAKREDLTFEGLVSVDQTEEVTTLGHRLFR